MKCIFMLLMIFWGLFLLFVVDVVLWIIIYLCFIDDIDVCIEYFIVLFKLVLEKIGVNYELLFLD